ncbi:hypothetical protein BJV74DRAFT_798869 [Russula compacta]|nr:hypothetical protein BJV74DRAFT_798869 [Russula compacta]
MSRHSTRVNAPTNLEDTSVPIAMSTKAIKRKRTADDMASKAKKKAFENLEESPLTTPMSAMAKEQNLTTKNSSKVPKPKHGQPLGTTKAAKNLKVLSVTIPTSVKDAKRKCTVDNMASKGKDTFPKAKHGRPPAKKRTSAEVAAAAKHKADLQRQADELEQKWIETLAEMELKEEAEECAVIRKWAEATSLDDADDVEMQPEDGEGGGASIDDADVELVEEDNGMDREGKVVPKQKQKKAVKGETQAAVDKVKASLQAVKKAQTVGDQNKTKAKFPSGLIPNWQSKLSAPSQTSLKTKVKVSDVKAAALGGLDDDNAFTTFSPLKLKGMGSNHKNEISTDVTQSVIIESTSEDSNVVPVKKKTSTAKPKAAQKSVPAVLEAKPSLKPKPCSAGLKVPNLKLNVPPLLPALQQRILITIPIPFSIDVDMLKVTQRVVDISYPDVEYELKAISKYAKWASRGDGLAIFGIPSPIECNDKNTANYIKLKDIFESDFVIQLLTQYLKWTQGLCYGDGQPYGAITMAATTIENAFLMHTMGIQVDLGQFSQDMVGSIVAEYAKLAQVLSERHWKKIMKLCGALSAEQKPTLKVNFLDCWAMYELSSPTKGLDDE